MFNYIDETDEALRQGANNTYAHARGSFPRLGIPDPALTLKAPLDEFEAALVAADDKNTGVMASIRREEAEEAFDKAFRNYENQHMSHNPLVTDVDRAMTGDHIPKDTHTPVPRPTTKPEVTTDTRNEREVTFGFGEHGAKRMGRPEGIGACVIRWGIFDREPTDISELVNKETITRSPFTLTFKESDRGKKLYFVACWQINRGRLEGPMTEIRFVIIP